MGISEREYAEMLRRNCGPDGFSVVDDGRPADDAATLALEANAGALGVEMAPPALAAQSIVLPLPPSANRYWRHANGHTYVSEEAENYKAAVALRARLERMTPYAGDVAMYVRVYRQQARGDLDNFAKICLDSLNGAAYLDDSQVVELHMFRHDDRKNPRVEVEIRRVQC